MLEIENYWKEIGKIKNMIREIGMSKVECTFAFHGCYRPHWARYHLSKYLKDLAVKAGMYNSVPLL